MTSNNLKYYDISKKSYCTAYDYFDCRDCEMCDTFEKYDYNVEKCREKLIIGLSKETEKLLDIIYWLTDYDCHYCNVKGCQAPNSSWHRDCFKRREDIVDFLIERMEKNGAI